jgi:hypothetical protein
MRYERQNAARQSVGTVAMGPADDGRPRSRRTAERLRAFSRNQPGREMHGGTRCISRRRDQQSSQAMPFVMTNAMKVGLRGRGLSDDEIANLTPAQAHEILGRPNDSCRPPPGINGGSQSPPRPNNVPVTFLERLRPGGPWLLIAIVPEGKPTAISADTTDQIEAFVREHNGRANLYYLVNPTRTAVNKKAAKKDIAAIEYVLGDLDPACDETSEAAKARYLEQLNGTFEPKPTAGIDSGNGIQGGVECQEWQRIGLCPPKAVTDATESYLESEDVLGEWLNECCIRDPNAWESSTALFSSWKGWAVGREEWIGSETTFSAKLEDRGEFKKRKNKEQTKRGFTGLRLKGAAEKGVAEKGVAESATEIDNLISLR